MLESTFHSNCLIFLYEWWKLGDDSCFRDFFAVCYRIWNIREAFGWNKSKQYLFCWVDLVFFEKSNKVLHSIEATEAVPIKWLHNLCCCCYSTENACSVSTSFSWNHGFGHLFSYCSSHAGLFNHTVFWSSSTDIPQVPMSAVFSTTLTCLRNPSICFPVFSLLCWQRTLVASCALLKATVGLLMSWSNDKFSQCCHHVHSVPAFWDKLHKLWLGVLTSVLSYVWWWLNDFSLLHKSGLTLSHFGDMTHCTLLLMHL